MLLISSFLQHFLSYFQSSHSLIIPLHLLHPSAVLICVMPHEHLNDVLYLWRSEKQIIVALPFTLLLGLSLSIPAKCIQVFSILFSVFLGSSMSYLNMLLFLLPLSARSVFPPSKHGFPHTHHLTGSENNPFCVPIPPVSLSLSLLSLSLLSLSSLSLSLSCICAQLCQMPLMAPVVL